MLRQRVKNALGIEEDRNLNDTRARVRQASKQMACHSPGGVALISAAIIAMLLFGATPALAAAGPAWAVHSVAQPTNFSLADGALCEPGDEPAWDCDEYMVSVENVGTARASGTVTIRDTLPPGITGGNEQSKTEEWEPGGFEHEGVVVCPDQGAVLVCTYEGAVAPGGVIVIPVIVNVTAGAPALVTNVVQVQGGGAPPARSAPPSTVANTVGSPTPAFGIQDFATEMLGAGGEPYSQAGGHPATMTTTFDLNTVFFHEARKVVNHEHPMEVQSPKTQVVDLPPGLVGDPLVTERCPAVALTSIREHPEKCAHARVGVATVESNGGELQSASVYNIIPEAGYPAEFAFEVFKEEIVLLLRLLPSAGGYVLSAAVPFTPRVTLFDIGTVSVTFFGDPIEAEGRGSGEMFFTDPDDCAAGPLSTRLELDSWLDPGDWQSAEPPLFEAGGGRGVVGCGSLRFGPSVGVSLGGVGVDSPAGLDSVVRVPQSPDTAGESATPDVKGVVLSLPAGVSLSPGAANGLVACQASGPEGIELGSGDRFASENRVEEGEVLGSDGLVHAAAGHCPAASQVGEVEVETPLLAAHTLKGHLFLAAPGCGGAGQQECTEASASDGELYGLFLEVAGAGVVVKERLDVSVNPASGQITTVVRELPQFPFSEVRVLTDGGPRAPLSSPQSCGVFTASAVLTPWSSPYTPDARSSSQVPVGGCAGPAGLAPGFSAGSSSRQAANSGAFSMTLSRHDGEQNVAGVSVGLPPGLVGLISKVPLCGEPQAADGACGEGSLIGSATVAAGAGGDPFWVTGGRVYLTGPYAGAPFGLSVVVPAKAGPFNLGDVVVRAAITVNPVTTAATVTAVGLPLIRDGVPFRLKTINVQVNRPGFMVNPTDCGQLAVTGTVAGSAGAVADVSSPFAVQGCRGLAFKPSFTASTAGRASKADGASLDVKVSYPAAGEANIRSVRTELPVALPSRLSTLQKACTAVVFESDPAGCPAASVVGVARARSPVLAVELRGPVYLVSHGGEKFPNLVIVLQGEGVRVDLIGLTDIKKGVTSETFNSVPDDPVNSFELYLPRGKFSILGTDIPEKAHHDLCGRKLVMPTVITGQNGAVIRRATVIKTTGCPAGKPKKKG